MTNIFYLLLLFIIVILFLFFSFRTRQRKGRYEPMIQHKIFQPGRYRYTISIPESYSENHRVPLVLALHYAGHGSPFYGELMLLGLVEPAFKELAPIIVAPDCPDKDWLQPKSQAYLIDLLDHIQDNYQVDPHRILIIGYSMGGIGAWHSVRHHPERFSAAIIMAAPSPEDALEVEWQVPLMLIHGKKDELFPIQKTQRVVVDLEVQGVDITFRILDGVSHYETHFFVSALMNTLPWLENRWKNFTLND